jgi:hypothetical protein
VALSGPYSALTACDRVPGAIPEVHSNKGAGGADLDGNWRAADAPKIGWW